MSRKLSLVIDDRAEAAIAPFLLLGSPQRSAAGLPDDAREAAILRTLLVKGAEALERERLAAGYADLAAEFGDQETGFAAESRTAMTRVLEAEAAATGAAA
jgi:hypothetical protein